jgi:hypothetical protein
LLGHAVDLLEILVLVTKSSRLIEGSVELSSRTDPVNKSFMVLLYHGKL